jgi:hypothetical protein
MGLFNFLTKDIAIDLGTANTLIIHKDQVVVDEPSIIALDRNTNKVLAESLKISPAEITHSLNRSAFAGLLEPLNKRVNRHALLDFLKEVLV